MEGEVDRKPPKVNHRGKKQIPATDPDFDVNQSGDKSTDDTTEKKRNVRHGYKPGEDEDEYRNQNDDDDSNALPNISNKKDDGTSSVARRLRILNRIQDSLNAEFENNLKTRLNENKNG